MSVFHSKLRLSRNAPAAPRLLSWLESAEGAASQQQKIRLRRAEDSLIATAGFCGCVAPPPEVLPCLRTSRRGFALGDAERHKDLTTVGSRNVCVSLSPETTQTCAKRRACGSRGHVERCGNQWPLAARQVGRGSPILSHQIQPRKKPAKREGRVWRREPSCLAAYLRTGSSERASAGAKFFCGGLNSGCRVFSLFCRRLLERGTARSTIATEATHTDHCRPGLRSGRGYDSKKHLFVVTVAGREPPVPV